MLESKEKYKIIVVAILLAGACYLTYYFHVVLETGTIFTHYFYIPIILAALWWRRKGLAVAIFLAALLIFSHTLVRAEVVAANDYLRAFMFVVVALVVAILSEKIENAEAKLRNYAKYLKDEVEKRTKDLAKERDYTRHLIESSPDFQIILDKDGKIRDVNEAFEHVVGKSRVELIGSSIYEYLLKEETEKAIAEIFEKGKSRNIELTVAIQGKEALICNFSGTVFTTPEGELGIYATGRDITEQRRAEEALRQKSEEQKVLLSTIPAFVYFKDENDRYVAANRAFADMTGTPIDEIAGKTDYDFFPREEAELYRKCDQEVMRAGEPKYNIEESVTGADGKKMWVSTSKTPLFDFDGNVIGMVGITLDITERKRAEKELRTKELQLVHSSRLSSLGEMATGIAHEINQPLSIISMAAEGILRDIKKKRLDVSMLPKDIGDISKNVQRIDGLITHMRTYARRPEEWQSVEPAELLNDAFVMLGEQFRVHNIAVSREVEDGLPAIEVDPHQVEQVFVNILLNARQVLDERGEEAEREGRGFEKRLVCRVSGEKVEEEDYVVFEFADNAYGVPEDKKTRIFEPFFTTKETGEGTGLGLSIAYGIVTQALDGKIWVEDNEMGGASFKVALPVTPEVRSQRSEVRSQRSEVRGQKSEVRGQRSEVRSQKSEVRGQKSEVRSQRSEVRSQRTEVRKKIENRK